MGRKTINGSEARAAAADVIDGLRAPAGEVTFVLGEDPEDPDVVIELIPHDGH